MLNFVPIPGPKYIFIIGEKIFHRSLYIEILIPPSRVSVIAQWSRFEQFREFTLSQKGCIVISQAVVFLFFHIKKKGKVLHFKRLLGLIIAWGLRIDSFRIYTSLVACNWCEYWHLSGCCFQSFVIISNLMKVLLFNNWKFLSRWMICTGFN